MKKGILFFCFFCIFINVKSQTIFTYGNHSVDKSEFLRVYQKNKKAALNDTQSLIDYLNLYSIFKMKVQAAKDLGLDKTKSFQDEIADFRMQIMHNYLRDDAQLNNLVEEAFIRMQSDIKVKDYFVKISGLDSEMTTKKLDSIYNILNKVYDYAGTISSFADEHVKIEESDFGYVTAFSLPYEFESVLYSENRYPYRLPVETKKGYHFLGKINQRPALGRIKVAQILIAFPPNSPELKSSAKKLVDSIYGLLKSGADFSEMVKKYSNDRSSILDDGRLPEFGVGEYSPAFEQAAFSLEKNNDIAPPVETDLGFHIIKRISKEPIPSSLDENFRRFLIDKVMDDERGQLVQKSFMNTVISKTKMNKINVNILDVWNVIDSSLMENKKIKYGSVDGNTALVSFEDGSSASVADFIVFLRNSDAVLPSMLHQSYENLLPKFYDEMALENYKKNLEKFDTEFNHQMEEFKEGNLLFEVMQKMVWTKASMDSSGQKKYYDKNIDKYIWRQSADVVIFNCKNMSTAKKAIKELKEGKNWMDIWNHYVDELQVDSGRYELSQLINYELKEWKLNYISKLVINPQDQSANFVKIIKDYPAYQKRSFEEARGLVINDYQNEIEQQWITQLKKKYPLKINMAEFEKLLKNNTTQ